MTWWAAGNARQPQGPQTRELANRPDRRLLGTRRAGSGPAPSQNIFIGNLVIVHGTGPTSGVFIYNGSPGLGNPPQIAEVPTGVTQDPYGNAITSSKILMQGNVITESGGIFRTSATAPLIQLDGPHDALLVYNAASGLTETIAPVATTDGLGSNVLPGVATYLETTPFIALQLFGATVQWYSGAGAGGPWTANRSSITDLAGALSLLSGTVGGASQASLTMTSAATIAGIVNAFSGAVGVAEQAAPPATLNTPLLFGNASGHWQARADTAHGDGGLYGIERAIQANAANVVLSNTAFTSVFAGQPVAAAVYLVKADLLISVGATATQLIFQLVGPAVNAVTNVKWRTTFEAGTGESVFAGHSIGSLASVTVPSTTFPIGSVVHVWLSAYVSFSAASAPNLNLQVELGVASAGSQVSLGSTLEIMPV